MGRYINNINGKHIGKSFIAKWRNLVEAGAERIEPTEFVPNMVCLVDNGHFAAAAHAYDEREMNVFLHPDPRPKQWFVLKGVEQYVD